MAGGLTLISPYNNILSYGVRSISTYLRSHGVDVSVIYLINDFDVPYQPDVLERLVDFCGDSDLIGISVISNYFSNCVQIVKTIKSRLDTPIVWGGVHPTISPEECLDYCDVVVIGEGEETLLELVRSIKNRDGFHNIEGTAVKVDGRLHSYGMRPLMNVGDLPVIDNNFSSDYILADGNIRSVTDDILKRYITSDYMTLSSFGCAFSCSYCINNKLKKIYSGGVRFRTVDHIMDELVNAKKKMPFIKHIWFDDDAFMVRPPDDIRTFAREYSNRIHMPFFVSGLNPRFITEDKLEHLIEAGMDRVKMGIQSGSEKSQKLYNRNIPNDKIIQAANIINKFRKKLKLTSFDIILDNPFESPDDIIQTILLLNNIPPPFTLNLFSLTFYPGTSMYEKAVEAGMVTNNMDDVYNKHYLDISNTYLNFIVVLYTIAKIPYSILKMLISSSAVKRYHTVPRTLFKFAVLLGYIRRGMDFLVKGDPYTLVRHFRVRVTK